MGYTTDFEGCFKLDKPLTIEHKNYLTSFSNTRRVKRNESIAASLEDQTRVAVNLDVGRHGCYYVGSDNRSSVLDYNTPPADQPGLWCDWIPRDDGMSIIWNGSEKFYYYVQWIKYLINNFLSPWGYVLSGEVVWQGEDSSDVGKIIINDNVVKVLRAELNFIDSTKEY